MARHFRRLLSLTATLLLLGACAQQAEVIKVFDNPQTGSRPYASLLVVGITGDEQTRQGLERTLADDLEAAGVTATAAYTLTGGTAEPGREAIDAAVRQSEADAVLVTHFVSIDTKAEVEEARSEMKSVCRGGDPADYFLYDYEEITIPESLKVAHTVVAVSNFYDASSGERLWSVQSTCFDKESFDEVLVEEAQVITRQLARDGLID